MTINDARLIIHKGKARPSPGPDGWEKWMVKSLNDFSFQLVVDLCNYEILHSHIPDCIKPCTLSTIHKRRDRTNLANTRGVVFNNFLLTHLSQLEAWSNRTKMPLYILRRDQQKGFDKLEPDGFYNAIRAYGLPSSLIEFDRSAQLNVPYRIKTAYGFTDTITVSGVTKQGGPLSPLKSTLTTSLGNHYCLDCSTNQDGCLYLSSLQHREHKPHMPADDLTLQISMVEATDDSDLLATTQNTLQHQCLMMECFQAAYGWLMN
ncbi:hypothetical protein EW146_g7553 [Bondarzewia mesenterica]|uniref:Reverse transcriptase domain-containing protein n=1 Tax=Bondarzewia mesenterica TaxID=1095465 RepID=A0A4V3XEA0_9AGAM|nr:hypothetical protein EW146_g7553 [Bondarzewia mesenterica]